MKFFLDTADIAEIREAAALGVLDGVTTNPSLVAMTGKPFLEVLSEICEIVSGPVSAEVVATDLDGILKEGRHLAKVAPNIVVKVPLIKAGLKAVKQFSDEGIKTNVTLCFSPLQALMAAKAGATYISPFIGRLDDISHQGMELVAEIRTIYDNYPTLHTEVLVASVRHPLHVRDAALAGADVATVPFKVFDKIIHHPLTDIGLERFLKDFEKVPGGLGLS